MPLLLAVQDGYINVQAAGSIDLGGIYQPTRLRFDLTRNLKPDTVRSERMRPATLPSAIGAFFDSYGPNSGVSLSSQSGSIAINSLLQSDGTGGGYTDTLFAHTPSSLGGLMAYGYTLIAPNLSVTALTGNIQLANGPLQFRPSLPVRDRRIEPRRRRLDHRSATNGSAMFGVNLTLADYASSPYAWAPMLGSQPAALTRRCIPATTRPCSSMPARTSTAAPIR